MSTDPGKDASARLQGLIVLAIGLGIVGLAYAFATSNRGGIGMEWLVALSAFVVGGAVALAGLTSAVMGVRMTRVTEITQGVDLSTPRKASGWQPKPALLRAVAPLEALRRRTATAATLGVVALGVGWAIAPDRTHDHPVRAVVAGLAMLLGGVSAMQAWSWRKGFRRLFKRAAIPAILADVAPELRYVPDNRLREDELAGCGLFRDVDYTAYESEDLLVGRLGGVQLKAAEVRLATREVGRGPERGFSGLVAALRLKEPVAGAVAVTPNVLGNALGDADQFDARFKVREAAEGAAKALTPELKQRMLAVVGQRSAACRFALHRDVLFVAVPLRGAWLEPRLFRRLDRPDALTAVADDLQELKEIVALLAGASALHTAA